MIQSTTFDPQDIRQNKYRFWINWVVSNALGVSIGWCLGEYLGQLALRSFGLSAGAFTAAMVFELCLWLARLLPSQYFSKQRPLKNLDIGIWLSTELFFWIVFSFFESSPAQLTSETIFIVSMGVTFWIIYAVFGLVRTGRRHNPPEWFSKAFIYVLLGFGLGNMFVVFIMTTAMSISDYFGKAINLYVGFGVGGIFLGGMFGVVTGLILVATIDWSRQYRFED